MAARAGSEAAQKKEDGTCGIRIARCAQPSAVFEAAGGIQSNSGTGPASWRAIVCSLRLPRAPMVAKAPFGKSPYQQE
jgi:hypothetical protein